MLGIKIIHEAMLVERAPGRGHVEIYKSNSYNFEKVMTHGLA